MSADKRQKSPFPSAREAALSARLHIDSPQCRSASYKLAFQDPDFLLQDELRPVRLQLELLKPELILQEQHIGMNPFNVLISSSAFSSLEINASFSEISWF